YSSMGSQEQYQAFHSAALYFVRNWYGKCVRERLSCFIRMLYFYQPVHKFDVLKGFIRIFRAAGSICGVFALLDLYN
ncbi:hypothetical protein, partial [Thiolapillus sp.]|uniref:hypothetical protein n=1 Tax=Thiolapillus sp. TaxID=2017437 RepID=UPI003AF54D51